MIGNTIKEFISIKRAFYFQNMLDTCIWVRVRDTSGKHVPVYNLGTCIGLVGRDYNPLVHYKTIGQMRGLMMERYAGFVGFSFSSPLPAPEMDKVKPCDLMLCI
jgi:hypothetical protein